MPAKAAVDLPPSLPDERQLLLAWLGFLRGAVLRNLDGISEDQARWTPDGALICLLGVVRHLTNVERRWIEGRFAGGDLSRREEEFQPDPGGRIDEVVVAYQKRAAQTDEIVRSLPSITTRYTRLEDDDDEAGRGRDLRWVLLHLINETGRHAGHADAVRELLDGTTGE
jgi:uncharacterized damage-inducible protein DinB